MDTLEVVDWGGAAAYGEVLAEQERLHAARVAGAVADTLLLLEHRPVYTLGRGASDGNVLFSAEALRRAGIERVATTRGGDVTYHGPGQLVGYPIIHLGAARLRVLEYVTALEEVLLRVVRAYGVAAGRDPRNRGVWVGEEKLAALGIRVSRQVAMHGFALNVDPRLDDYRGIVACGLRGVGVTSLARLLGRAPAMAEVKARVAAAFGEVFGYASVRVVARPSVGRAEGGA